MVSATRLSGYWSNDRLLGTHQQSETDSYWSRRPVWYFRSIHDSLSFRFRAKSGCRNCHHWRSRRTYRHLPLQQVESKPDGSHCGLCLLLHGVSACDSATFDATSYHQERACHQDETSSPSKSDREDTLPYHRFIAYHFYRAKRFATTRYAFLRKSPEREWQDNKTRQDSWQQPERHRGDAPRSDSRMFHPGIRISDPQHH